jgi:hypothetical protein
MKIHYNYSFAFLLLFCFVNCSTKKELYQINCVSIENEGYVKLKITNLIKPLEYQIESANKDAVKSILYSGYTSTQCQTQKPILRQLTDIENFKKIQSNFFSKNGVWKTFVRNDSNEQNATGFEVMVNKDQLRKYLEEKQIIKSLNNGF